MKNQRLLIGLIFCFSVSFLSHPTEVPAQADPFYKGKTIRIIVGSTPGGFYDRWARLFARYMAKYIPGQPEIIAQNMPGAGSVIATNHVFGVAKPDGLTIGMPLNSVYVDQLVGRKEVQFDLRKFQWIGSPAVESVIFYIRAGHSLPDDRRCHQGQGGAQMRLNRDGEQRLYLVESIGRDRGSKIQHRAGLSGRKRDRLGGGKRRSRVPRPQHVGAFWPGAV